MLAALAFVFANIVTSKFFGYHSETFAVTATYQL